MNEQELSSMRHSLSHILAQAVLKFYPEAKLTIGPAVDNGFYYDFDLGDKSFSEEDLKNFQKEMEKIIKDKQKFEQFDLSVDEAKERLANNPYKLELIEDLVKEGETTISFYRNVNNKGEVTFEDMCIGPHAENTREIGAFKLDKIAGAYWRGKEENKMLQRIYGLAFATKDELFQYLKMREEAEKRDHRKIGKEQQLFILDQQVGMGLPLWLPKGALLWRVMEDFWYQEHLKNGYDLVRSPHIGSRSLWETSGHWGFYSNSMYPPLEIGQSLESIKQGTKTDAKEEYLLKPMNCPFHVVLYQSSPKSYRDFPIRYAECGTVYRYEKSGEVSGLTRVRGFTQDDAHIICRKDQVEEELGRVVDFIIHMLSTFGFNEYNVYLSLRDPKNSDKYAGNDEGWEFTQAVLEKVAIDNGLNYTKEEGEAAFYGPKLDFKIKDCIGREWQCSTLQFDFNLPNRFNMAFRNSEGQDEKPYMLHRALFGSFERFIGVLIEHYAGNFPVWLAPVQVKVIAVGAAHATRVVEVVESLKAQGVRVEANVTDETVGYKIRQAEKEKVPYMVVIGDKEVESGKLTVRVKGIEGQTEYSVEDFATEIITKTKDRK